MELEFKEPADLNLADLFQQLGLIDFLYQNHSKYLTQLEEYRTLIIKSIEEKYVNNQNMDSSK